MNYGLSYKGSKSRIAKWVVEALPSADVWVEPFVGGCAVTHAAILSGKYKRFIINDITDSAKFFADAVNGKFKDENRWISREDFFRLKKDDTYVRLCFSFGNNQRTYCYSEQVEPYKKAFHYAICFGDFSLFEDMGISIPEDVFKGCDTFKDRRHAIKDILVKLNYPDNLQRLQNMERLERLWDLQSLQGMGNIEVFQGDYRELGIPEEEKYVIYCDPPYINTEGYSTKFSHEEFYGWAKRQKNCYISEYWMPEDFERVDYIDKTVLFCGNNKGCNKQEGLWICKNNLF